MRQSLYKYSCLLFMFGVALLGLSRFLLADSTMMSPSLHVFNRGPLILYFFVFLIVLHLKFTQREIGGRKKQQELFRTTAEKLDKDG